LQKPSAFIGLGVMGKPIGKNTRPAGNRVSSTTAGGPPFDELVAAARRSAAGLAPEEVAPSLDLIITMLPDTSDVEECYRPQRRGWPACSLDRWVST